MVRFVINMKALKGVSYLLILCKGKNEMLCKVSYKLGLTPSEKLWDNLTLNPLADLRDLMT